MPQYKEEWCVMINRKATILNEMEKPKLEIAMKNGDRWFKTEKGDILSVNHIESVTLNSKWIKNQLEASKEDNEPLISEERYQQLKQEALRKIGH